jgi:hypothetical protein
VTDEALTAGAVARQLGVAVTTLRTWHQRYGLGPSQHVPGKHRRYTPEDLARLEVMRRLTARGVTPAEAARWARRTDSLTVTDALTPTAQPPTGGPAGPSAHPPTGPPVGPPGPPAGPPPTGPPVRPSRPPVGPPGPGAGGARDGGGHTIPVGRAGATARGLARAAMRLDATAIRETLEGSLGAVGVIGTWDDVIVPVLIGIGERHSATRRLVEVEHLFSRGVSDVLGAVPRSPQPASALLACADEEQHSLPLEALAAALAEADVGCRLLGARVPPTALAEAVDRTGPAAVVIWSQLPGTANPAQLTRLLDRPRRPLLVMAAGPGWSRDAVPDDIAVPVGLRDAVAIIFKAVTDGPVR